MARQLDIAEPKVSYRVVDKAFDLAFNKDLNKAFKGNKAAARRCRKALLELQRDCKNARLELLEIIQNK